MHNSSTFWVSVIKTKEFRNCYQSFSHSWICSSVNFFSPFRFNCGQLSCNTTPDSHHQSSYPYSILHQLAIILLHIPTLLSLLGCSWMKTKKCIFPLKTRPVKIMYQVICNWPALLWVLMCCTVPRWMSWMYILPNNQNFSLLPYLLLDWNLIE